MTNISDTAENAPNTGDAAGELETADIKRIMELLPHRYPMLLIDRIVEMNGTESAVGIKNVTINDNFFQGHFPDHPVMPGVLIVEAMAQTAGALVVNATSKGSQHKVVYFMTIDKARFRKPVVPGDRLEVHVRKLQNRGPVWKFHADAKVDGKIVAEADYSAMIVESDGTA